MNRRAQQRKRITTMENTDATTTTTEETKPVTAQRAKRAPTTPASKKAASKKKSAPKAKKSAKTASAFTPSPSSLRHPLPFERPSGFGRGGLSASWPTIPPNTPTFAQKAGHVAPEAPRCQCTTNDGNGSPQRPVLPLIVPSK